MVLPGASRSSPDSEDGFRKVVQIDNSGSSPNVSRQSKESEVTCSSPEVAVDAKSLTKESTHPMSMELDDPASKWLTSLADYVGETETSLLDLRDRGLETEEIQSVLSLLSNSQITELNLDSNYLKNGIKDVLPFLIKTKIKRLNVSKCRLTKGDILQLMEALKDSQITELDIKNNFRGGFDIDETRRFISYLKNSKLTALFINFNSFFRGASLQGFLNTSITCLDLRACRLRSNDFIFLFKNLSQSAVTDLNVVDNMIPSAALEVLSEKLGETKLERLNLDGTGLENEELKILVKGLPKCSVINLGLPNSNCSTFIPLFTRLKETKIRSLSLDNSCCQDRKPIIVSRNMDFARLSSLASLNISNCSLQDKNGETLMEVLRSSNVTNLDISHNLLGLRTIRKLADNIKDMKLVDLDISHNSLRGDEISILGGCLKDSKLSCLNISSSKMKCNIFEFLKFTEQSSISRIKMDECDFCYLPLNDPTLYASFPVKELHLSDCGLRSSVLNLVKQLKFTSVTYLNLSFNQITDVIAVDLAVHLRETKIRRLDLSNNRISYEGAKALANVFRKSNLLYLDLKENYLLDDELRYLAKMAKKTFLTELHVHHVTYDDSFREVLFLIDEVLWQNKTSAVKLVRFFKQIAPRTNSDKFRFSQNIGVLDNSAFFGDCLWLYKSITNKPQAVSVLLEEDSIQFSREEILSLFSEREKFPRQFSQFVTKQIDIHVSNPDRLLKLAAKNKLTIIVEELQCGRG